MHILAEIPEGALYNHITLIFIVEKVIQHGVTSGETTLDPPLGSIAKATERGTSC